MKIFLTTRRFMEFRLCIYYQGIQKLGNFLAANGDGNVLVHVPGFMKFDLKFEMNFTLVMFHTDYQIICE